MLSITLNFLKSDFGVQFVVERLFFLMLICIVVSTLTRERSPELGSLQPLMPSGINENYI